MSINWTQIASTVETIASDIQRLAPLAAVAGPEGAAIGALVAQGAAYISSAASMAALNIPGLEAITSNDLATIQAADAAIQADMAIQSILIQAT